MRLYKGNLYLVSQMTAHVTLDLTHLPDPPHSLPQRKPQQPDRCIGVQQVYLWCTNTKPGAWCIGVLAYIYGPYTVHHHHASSSTMQVYGHQSPANQDHQSRHQHPPIRTWASPSSMEPPTRMCYPEIISQGSNHGGLACHGSNGTGP
jgi:hypothetical protein